MSGKSLNHLICLTFLMVLGLIRPLPVASQSIQTRLIHEHARRSIVQQYQPDNNLSYEIISSDFSLETLRQIGFADRQIKKIDLVYTTYSSDKRFDQDQLNLNRIDNLLKLNPKVAEQPFFSWNLIGQTGCHTSASCEDLFHGFVIYYDPDYNRTNALKEIDSIKTRLRKTEHLVRARPDFYEVDYDRIPCKYPGSLYDPEYLTSELDLRYQCSESYRGRVYFQVQIDEMGQPGQVQVLGRLFPCKPELSRSLKEILAWKSGLSIDEKHYPLMLNGYVSFPLKKESIFFTDFEIRPDVLERYHMLQQYNQCVAYAVDTSYHKVLDRLNTGFITTTLNNQMENINLIVVDVTGSMFPYTTEMLQWIKYARMKGARQFVFFNDGDDLPDADKEPGKTGGLYHINSDNFPDIKSKMFEAMRGGGGGDLVENNFEALLDGAKQISGSVRALMITDNRAFPRDVSLLEDFEGDLQIILCETKYGINPRYLDLVNQENVVLHTEEGMIKDVPEDFRFGKYRYRKSANGMMLWQ